MRKPLVVAVALSTIAAMCLAGASSASASSSMTADAAKARFPGISKSISIKPITIGNGARSLGLASATVFAQATKTGTINVTLGSAQPYARIVPVTGDPYFASAGELAQNFSALLGPAPTIGISYGEKDRQRSLTLTDSVTPPIYDVSSQSISFKAQGTLKEPIANVKALVTFIATDVNYRAGRPSAPKEIQISNLSGRADDQADTATSYTYSSSTFLSPAAPPTMLSATQQIFSGNQCVKYDQTGASTGGQIVGVSSLDVESSSTDVSESVKAGTSASLKYGGLKTSMSASYAQSSSQDSSSLYAVGNVAVAGIGTTLSPTLIYDASKVTDINAAVQLIAACGDSVGTGYTSGAKYQAVLQMKTTSKSQAQSLEASLSVSYSEPGSSSSGGASFAGAVSSNSSVQNVQITELCLGPSSCQDVPGYAPIDETNTTTALNSFSNNYAAMQKGLGNLCQSPSSASNCVVNMNYAPIENIISGSISNASTAKSLVSQASNGVYWMLTNASTWANEYQSLATAFTQAATYQNSNIAKYTLTSDQLNTQAASYQSTANNLLAWAGKTCNGAQVGSATCLPVMVNCSNVVFSQGSTASACLPPALSSFSGLADPSTLAAPQLVSPPADCNTAFPSHGTNDNEQLNLYLGGIQAVSYPVWCVWTNGALTTYLQVTGTSKTDSGTTTYSWAQFDPSTGALFSIPGSYPSNVPAGILPSCPTAPCAPLGYAMSYKNSSAVNNFSVTLPSNLGFATTTTQFGTGNASVTTPSPRGVVSNSWKVSQPAQGSSQLTDSNFKSSGISLVVPLSSAYKFTPASTAVPVTYSSAASVCVVKSTAKPGSNGNAGNNETNQQLEGIGYINGVPGACTAQLHEYDWKNNGASAWTDKYFNVTGQYGYMYPTFICGSRTHINGQLQYYIDPTSGYNVQVKWWASNSSGYDPTMDVVITYDNVNRPLTADGQWHYVWGDCSQNTHSLQADVSPQ